jgi:hypothetical protein
MVSHIVMVSPLKKKVKLESDDALLNWFIHDNIPFRMVESDNFIEFCNTLDASYKLPVRQTISTRIDKKADSIFEEKKAFFNELKGIYKY